MLSTAVGGLTAVGMWLRCEERTVASMVVSEGG